MELPSIWFLCRDPDGTIRLSFDYADSPRWEKGDRTTDLDEEVLYVFPEEDWDVLQFLNALYALEGFVEGPDDVLEWRFKGVLEKIIRAAVNVVTSSSHERNLET
ncbi:MAG: hypothetical protein A3D64_02700 [Candidatus Wildermuthbacteria bacterium RIFCSPHIGHO2_02_FULL_49_9]|uniref:Uncharacterized protein n=2 Tax=Candidatus Wildermuthiibacteriota TaxID=1817923 RepID=A0A1G2QVV6_9BACT|nr:MAG: hypothetical protein A2672_02100 [Candidatus Wildermuthbacteria bacterium RIFCSPHIGHO2_01_FULL_49_22b]OHA70017.1 MAG: hypothetical protein A3D64_02700 [Candidatus Wildermuthbacteria bacterium RIFCSPHIGHO2_02_FULL_49_9]